MGPKPGRHTQARTNKPGTRSAKPQGTGNNLVGPDSEEWWFEYTKLTSWKNSCYCRNKFIVLYEFVEFSRHKFMRFRNLLTPAEISLWDQLFCWLLKIYFCNSFTNHKLIELLIEKFDSLTPKFYCSSFIQRNHFLKFKVTIIITINSHYWLQVYQLTFYHVVMSSLISHLGAGLIIFV